MGQLSFFPEITNEEYPYGQVNRGIKSVGRDPRKGQKLRVLSQSKMRAKRYK
ncbi:MULTISPECIES: hypothetical protein [Bacillus cereus group]|uniref:hypothetical protein n=1 Tax=Bacillus cereus group TaxID=86661 RepID=UPI0002E82CA8|nr:MULTISPECIES: hypothetical protein [Bacillus cereus group]